MKDEWLTCQIPANGERDQAIYEMKLKATADPRQGDLVEISNPSHFGPGKHLTPNQNGSGSQSTRAKLAEDPGHFGKPPGPDWSLTRANLVFDPGHSGTPSNPKILHTPKILNTPNGTLSFEDTETPSDSDDDGIPWNLESNPGRIEQPKAKRSSEPFIQPDLATVAAYCSENGFEIDAAQFLAFYESKGWLVGKTKMKDWKAAVRGWHYRTAASKPKPVNRMPSIEEIKRRGWDPRTGMLGE